MITLPFFIIALCIHALACLCSSAFLAAKALVLDDQRATPSHIFQNGQNHPPTTKWVLPGHPFSGVPLLTAPLIGGHLV
ncbi:MAG: carbon starvation CstA family protein [Acidobacteriaceae bacterium]